MTQVPNPYFNPLVNTRDGKITREWLIVFNDLLSVAIASGDLAAINAAITALQTALATLQAQVTALGTITTGSGLLDFGAFPGSGMAQVSVPVLTNFDTVQAWILPVATADHSADEHVVEDLRIIAGAPQPGTGFTAYGVGPVYGKWSFAYVAQ